MACLDQGPDTCYRSSDSETNHFERDVSTAMRCRYLRMAVFLTEFATKIRIQLLVICGKFFVKLECWTEKLDHTNNHFFL